MYVVDRSKIQEVQNTSLYEVIFNQLEKMILSGEIPPGERINESRLSQLFGVSRTPIREACRQLERYGMVEVRVNQGTFVRFVDSAEAAELYEVRAVLEALAAEQAVRRCTPDDLERLEGLVRRMEELFEAGHTQAYFKVNLDFHAELHALGGNQSLLTQLDAIVKKISLFRRNVMDIPGEMAVSIREHRDILEAARKGDAREAFEIMRRHVMKGRKYILQQDICAKETNG